MRFYGLFAALLALTLTGSATAVAPTAERSPLGPIPAQVRVCFVPAQSCDEPIAAAIRNARTSIRVQAYGFTAPVILGALGDAKARGVDVRAILDKSNDPTGRKRDRDGDAPRLVGAHFTSAMGIPTWIDHKVAIAHNKLIIIDEKIVIGGSYNFTMSAEGRNAENVTFIDSPDIARLYLQNWEARRAASRPYAPPQSLGVDRAPFVAAR